MTRRSCFLTRLALDGLDALGGLTCLHCDPSWGSTVRSLVLLTFDAFAIDIGYESMSLQRHEPSGFSTNVAKCGFRDVTGF